MYKFNYSVHMVIIKTMYVERNMQMSSDLVTNQISLLNFHPNPAHRKYVRFACTILIGLKYLSTSILANGESPFIFFNFM